MDKRTAIQIVGSMSQTEKDRLLTRLMVERLKAEVNKKPYDHRLFHIVTRKLNYGV